MSEIININLENLTNEEREQLLALLKSAKGEAKTKKEWWEGTKFDVDKGKRYYSIYTDGGVSATNNCGLVLDEKRIAFGNVCKDKEYMERRAKEIKLYNLLSNFAEVVNEGWQPNWEDDDEMKCYILYHHYDKKWLAVSTYICSHPNKVYFKTEELAQRAIDEIIIPFEKGEL